ncbi:MAG TPA: hypothetical protein VMW74_02745 [Nitrosopumilaceae archaeon]|nr:hypothetical protein [Nitrosopumilaceae archaeon]
MELKNAEKIRTRCKKIGIGIFAIVIAPWVHLFGVMYFGFLSITPCLNCDFSTAWYRFNGMFLPGIIILSMGIFFLIRQVWKDKKNRKLKP